MNMFKTLQLSLALMAIPLVSWGAKGVLQGTQIKVVKWGEREHPVLQTTVLGAETSAEVKASKLVVRVLTTTAGNTGGNSPAQLFYRPHDGSQSAWERVPLTQDKDFAIKSVGAGSDLDPKRYEKQYYVLDASTLPEGFGSVTGEKASQYEWLFTAGSGQPIDLPIFDPWRAQDFNSAYDFDFMPTDTPNAIIKGSLADWSLTDVTIGAQRDFGVVGALFTNKINATVTSPLYRNGVSAVSFKVRNFSTETTGDGITIQVEYAKVDTPKPEDWHMIDGGRIVTNTVNTDPVELQLTGEALGAKRIRWVRVGTLSAEGSSALIELSAVRISSLAPEVRFHFKDADVPPAGGVTPVGYYAGQPFVQAYPTILDELNNRILVDESASPMAVGGYELKVAYQKKIAGLPTGENPIFYQALTRKGAEFISSLTVNMSDDAIIKNDAYYVDELGALTGLKAGLYTYWIEGSILGSFKAGRKSLSDREKSPCRFDLGHASLDAANAGKPFTLDLRERHTQWQQVELKTTLRRLIPDADVEGGFIPEDKDYIVQMQPSSAKDYDWQVILPARYSTDTSDFFYCFVDPKTNKAYDQGLGFTFITRDPYNSSKTDGKSCKVANWGVDSELELISPAVTPFGGQVGINQRDGVLVPNTEHTTPVLADLSDCKGDLIIQFNSQTGDYVIFRTAYQDFNQWKTVEADRFCTGENLIGQQSFLATFDVGSYTLGADGKRKSVATGWIPDAGPFATESNVFDSFGFVRKKADAGIAPDMVFDNDPYSSRWGVRDPLQMSFDSFGVSGTDGTFLIQKSGNVTEADRRRNIAYDGGAVLTTGHRSGMLLPRSLSTLKGIGQISFKAAAFLPLDYTKRMSYFSFLTGTGDLQAKDYYGVKAKVGLSSITSRSASGKSVSLFLSTGLSTSYEFRVSEVLYRDTSSAQGDKAPLTPIIVTELYSWFDGKPSRKKSYQIDNRNPAVAGGLDGLTLMLFINAQGHLQGNVYAGTTSKTALSLTDDSTTFTSGAITIDFLSAGCTPVLTEIRAAKERLPDVDASKLLNVNEWLTVGEMNLPVQGLSYWTQTAQGGVLDKLTRQTVSATVAVEQQQGDASSPSIIPGSEVDLTWLNLGSNATEIKSDVKQGAKTNVAIIAKGGYVAIDSVSISSWRGNDEQKNGLLYTGSGYNEKFSSIGTWIQPLNDSDLNASMESYSGQQYMIMQYSRRDAQRDIVPGSSLCLISPFSTSGFAPVSFSYKVPAVNNVDRPSGKFVLQYLATDGVVNSFLDNRSDAWVDVSEPFYLEYTQGEWLSRSIQPMIEVDGQLQPLRGPSYKGYLRLSMIENDRDPNGSADAAVHFDNVTMADFPGVASDNWTIENCRVRASVSELSQLYWLDRTIDEKYTPNYTVPFAEKTHLTPALTFNDNASSETYGNNSFGASFLRSPLTPNGLGVVSFAAKMAYLPDSGTNPTQSVYLYLQGTESESVTEAVVWDNLAQFEVKTLDFAPITCNVPELRKLNPDWTDYLDAQGQTEIVGMAQAKKYRRMRLFVNIVGGSNSALSTDALNHIGRVSIDRLLVQDPVGPSLRVARVEFSMKSGEFASLSDSENASALQPLVGAQLWVRTKLDRKLFDPEVKKVYFYYTIDSLVSKIGTKETTYTGLDKNLYTGMIWNPNKLWDRSGWFNRQVDKNRIVLAPDPKNPDYYVGQLPDPKLPATDGITHDFISAAAVNDVVRYNVVVDYTAAPESEDKKDYSVEINEPDFAQLPWYYPRDLNAENAIKYGGKGGFSPYVWIYSIAPGQVFINEVNLRDTNLSERKEWSQFLELCVPASVDLSGWSVRELTRDFTMDENSDVFVIGGEKGDQPSISITDKTRVNIVKDGKVVQTNRVFYLAADSNFDDTISYKKPSPVVGKLDQVIDHIAKPALVRDNLFNNTGVQSYPIALKVYRDNGAIEHAIVYSLRDNENAKDYIAEMLRENPDRAFLDATPKRAWVDLVYAGYEDSSKADDTTGKPDNRNLILSFGSRYMGNVPFGADPDALKQSWSIFRNTYADNDALEPNTFEVTPGSINLGQALTPYEGSSFFYVSSTLTGVGAHVATLNGGSVQSGGHESKTWSVSTLAPEFEVTYTPAIMHKVASASITVVPPGTEVPAKPIITIRKPDGTIKETITWAAGTIDLAAKTAYGDTLTIAFPSATNVLNGDVSIAVSFEMNPQAGALLKQITPFTSATRTPTQPWAGDNFGFAVTLDSTGTHALDGRYSQAELASYVKGSFIALSNKADVPAAWHQLLTGKDETAAREAMSAATATAPMIYLARASAMSDRYASKSAINRTTFAAESCVAFTSWLLVVDPLTTATFCVPQAESAFTEPTYYKPLSSTYATDKIPYFYFYSTPYGAAWINEVNLHKGTAAGQSPYVECVWPLVKDAAGNPVAEWADWKLAVYEKTAGTFGSTPVAMLKITDQTLIVGVQPSAKYSVKARPITDYTFKDNTDYAIVLVRPCGAGEGGLTSAIRAVAADQVIDAMAETQIPNVVAGVADSSTTVGAVALTSGTAIVDEDPAARISWHFKANQESPGTTNPDEHIPTDPDWSLVSFESRFVNDSIANAACGLQLFGSKIVDPDTAQSTPLTASRAPENFNGTTITYRADQLYHFVRLEVPAELLKVCEVTDSKGSADQWIVKKAEQGVVEFDRDYQKGKVLDVTLTIKGDLPASSEVIMVCSQGVIDQADWVVGQKLFKVIPGQQTTTVIPAVTGKYNNWQDVDAQGNITNKYQPLVGDKVGLVTVVQNALVNATRPTGQRNKVYLAWSLLPKTVVDVHNPDPSLRENWGAQAWITGKNPINGITIAQLRERLANPPKNELFVKGGLIELEDVTNQPPYSLDSSFGGDALRVYRTPIDAGIDCDPTTFLSGALVRFSLVYGDEKQNDNAETAKAIWQSMSAYNTQYDGKPVPYCPWYIPDDKVNYNTRLNDSAVSDRVETPFFWMYGTKPGGVWFNELRPRSTTDNGNEYDQSDYIELAMLDPTPDGVAKPAGISIKGWSVEVWRTIVTNLNYEDVQFEPCRDPIVLTEDWGKVQFKPEDSGVVGGQKLALYNLVRNITFVPEEQRLLVQGFEGSLSPADASATGNTKKVYYLMRLVRDNGVLEEEVIYTPSSEIVEPWEIEALIKARQDSGLVVDGRVAFINGTINPNTSVQLMLRKIDADAGRKPVWVSSPSFNTFMGLNRDFDELGADFQPVLAQPEFGYPGVTTFTLRADVMGGRGQIVGATDVELFAGADYALTFKPDPWYTVGGLYCNNETVPTPVKTPVFSTHSVMTFGGGAMARATTEIHVAGKIDRSLNYSVNYVLNPEAQQLIGANQLDPDNAALIDWLQQYDSTNVLDATLAGDTSLLTKYWLNLDPESVTPVDLTITQAGSWGGHDRALAVSLTTGDGVPVEQLQGDGLLVIQGKRSLTDADWVSLAPIDTKQANGQDVVTVSADYLFFRAVLIAERDYAASQK